MQEGVILRFHHVVDCVRGAPAPAAVWPDAAADLRAAVAERVVLW
jgi:hypothetical protein